MPYLLWSSEYETGIPLIDNDHQTLFAVVNLIHDRAETGLDDDAVARALGVLVMYVDRHFSREEAMLEANGYPDLVEHMAIHRRIAEKVHAFKTAFDENPGQIETGPFLEFLRDWLTGHILTTDMAYVPHIGNSPND
ncbi:MAG: bacteriohemerythrin [Magnetovibrio sp.]|nr:bacteriohemerythrin [Magnetovibrio sp.]